MLDPACGTGHFLVAAARRLGASARCTAPTSTPRRSGSRGCGCRPRTRPSPPRRSRSGSSWPTGSPPGRASTFDAVVGNPPFLGQLKSRTAGQRGGLGAYTDTSAAFLHRALGLAGPDGIVALVQPLSVLGARDAGPVREAAAAAGAVTDLWVSDRPVFRGTTVLACVPVVRLGASGGPGPDEWGRLAAPYFGIPDPDLAASSGRVGDLAVCTADFRDQYYGLVPHVREGGAGVPLITSGLIEPAACEWGSRPTRFARQRYDAPVVDVDAVRAGPLGGWVDARLVPKVLVAGQGRVIEAVVDERGEWLPSVPVLSVVPNRSPPTCGGSSPSCWRRRSSPTPPRATSAPASRPGSVKVSARQLAALPLPANESAWAEGAVLARRAQNASSCGPAHPCWPRPAR